MSQQPQTTLRSLYLPRRVVLATLALLAGLLVILAVTGVELDAQRYRGVVSRWLSSQLLRPVSIDGELKLRLGIQPSLRVQGLRVGQPAGFGDDDFLRIGELRFNLDLLPLWHGQLRADRLSASNVRLALRQSADGSANWTLAQTLPEQPTDAERAASMEHARLAAHFDIRQLVIEKLQVSYQAAGARPLQLALDALDARLPADGKLVATASGRVEEKLSYSLKLSGGSLQQLAQSTVQWPLALQLEFAGSTLSIQGTLGSAASELRFGLGTANLAQFGTLLGLDLPDAGVAGIGGLLRLAPGILRIDELSGQLGRSAMRGSLALDMRSPRPSLTGSLKLARLDLRPFLGQQDEEQTPTDLLALYRSLAQARLDLQALNRFDADLTLTVDEWISLPGDIRDASLALKLDHGKLAMPVMARLEGVPMRGMLSADASSALPSLSMELRSERSDVGGLARLLTGVPGIRGRLGSLRLRVASQGRDGQSLMRALSTQLELRDSQLSYGNLDGGKPVGFEVQLLRMNLSGEQALEGRFSGRLLGKPLEAKLEGGSLRAAMEQAGAEFSVTAQSPGFAARLTSSINAGKGEATLSFSLGAARAGDVAAWLGLRSDASAPLALAGRISGNPERWQLDNLVLQAGRSSASVKLSRSSRRGKPYYRAEIDVAQLDAAELDAMRAPSPATSKAPDKAHTSNRATLDIPLLPRQLALDDADIRVRVHGVQGTPVAVGEIGVDARLSEGYMQSSPFFAEISGNRFEGALMIDTRSSDPHAQMWLFAKNIDAGELAHTLKLAQGLELTVDSASLYLDSRSSRLSDFIANAQLLGEVRGGALTWRDPGQKTRSRIQLHKGSLSAAPLAPLSLSLAGEVDGLPVDLTLRSATARELLDPRSRVPFELTLAAADSQLALTGTLDRNIEARDLELRLSARGPRLDKLDRLLRIAMPPWGPWSAQGSLRIHGSGYTLDGLSLMLGSSALHGHGSLDTRSLPSTMMLELSAPQVQLDDFRLAGWSATEAKSAASTGSGLDQKALRKKATEASDQVQGLLSPQTLHATDASIRVNVGRVLSGSDVLGSGRLEAKLANGRAVIGPVSVEMPGGAAKLSLSYEPRDKDVLSDLKVDIDHFDYGVLGRRLQPDSALSGRFSLHMDVRSQAPQLSEALRHGSGTLDFAVWPQDMKAGVFDLWAVNLFLALLPTIDPKNESRVNCAIGRFRLQDGKLSQKQLVIDTSRVRVTGSTAIDLARESVHMRLQPQAKQAQFLSLSTPLEVKGSFSDFSIGPNAGDVMETVVRFATSIIWVPIKRLFSEKVPEDGRDVCGLG